jgi:hypothetical protein
VAPGTKLVANVSSRSVLCRENPDLVVDTVKADGDRAAYLRFSGTSMAAAVTTGVVAQMIDANRRTWNNGRRADSIEVASHLSPNTVKAILHYTALVMPAYDTLTQGAGAINGEGAVRLAAAIDTRAPADSWWASPTVGPSYSTIGTTTYVWASRIVWGDRVIWGDALFLNDAAWAQRIVWGDRVIWGDRVVWGDLSQTLIASGMPQ